MRQIDQMTPQELDTLALKGMTAPRRNSCGMPAIQQPPPTHVDMVHVEHRAKLAEQRLKEHIDALKWTRDNEKILTYQRDHAKAHADKLSEAIAKIRTAMDRGLDLTPSIYGAIATLKAYEAAQ